MVTRNRTIYIENQYFTCEFLIELLARRLTANKDLSVVLLLPRKSEISVPDEIRYQQFRAWVSRSIASEPIVAARAVQRLRSVDANRFFAASPINAAREDVYVHAKVMIVDDAYATIGSANFSQRSMFLDFELGVAWTDPDGSRIRDFRRTLWYEHLGIEGKEQPNLDDEKTSISAFWKARATDANWKQPRILEWSPVEPAK